jgi:hypothetical protein
MTDNILDSEDTGVALSNFKSSHNTSAVKINPSDRATLLSGHKIVSEIDKRTSGEIGNIYLGIRCKPGVNIGNFLAIPLTPLFSLAVTNTFIAL